MVLDGERRRTDEGAVFGASGGLEGALGLGGDMCGNVFRASPGGGAHRGAKIAGNTLDLNGLFVSFTSVFWVTVVAVGGVVFHQEGFLEVEDKGLAVLGSFNFFGAKGKVNFGAQDLVASGVDGGCGGRVVAVGGELANSYLEPNINRTRSSGALQASVVDCAHSQWEFDSFRGAAITGVREDGDVVEVDGHGVLARSDCFVDAAFTVDGKCLAFDGLARNNVNLVDLSMLTRLSTVLPGGLTGDGCSGKESNGNRLHLDISAGEDLDFFASTMPMLPGSALL